MIYESRIILTATTTARVKSMKKKKNIIYRCTRHARSTHANNNGNKDCHRHQFIPLLRETG